MNLLAAASMVLVAAATLSSAQSDPGAVDQPPAVDQPLAVDQSPAAIASGASSPLDSATATGANEPSASGSPFTEVSLHPSDWTQSPTTSQPPATAASMPDEVFAAMVDAIASQRPGYRFRLTPDRLDGDWRLDGSADDGTGPGRLFVDVTVKPGNVEPNPCADPDFVQGGRCVRKLLPGGAWLVQRGLVQANCTRTVVAALVSPNRTGIIAEASNFTIDGGAISILRRDPPYTAADLGELIVAIDRAIAPLTGN